MTQPYGTWSSPITATLVASQGLRLGAVSVDAGDVYWLEGRPAEGGRNVLVRRAPDGRITDLTPDGFNVRTRVHEYGGGAYLVAGGVAYFSNFADQRLYVQFVEPRNPRTHERTFREFRAFRGFDAGTPIPITPAAPCFYADGVTHPTRDWLFYVREEHVEGREPINTLVRIDLERGEHAGDVIASGFDFYSTPRVSPDGTRLSWLCWRHPQMPWDGSEVWVGELTDEGRIARARCVAGSARESIYQPGWSPDGTLYFVSDRDGWWRLYRETDAGVVEPLLPSPPEATEFGRPHWIFGTASWAFTNPSHIVTAFTTMGRWRLGTIDVETRRLMPLEVDIDPGEWLATTSGRVYLVGGSATAPDAVLELDLERGAATRLRSAAEQAFDPGYLSVAESITFPTTGGRTAHAFYYPPVNRDARADPGERPPLIAIGHGGPTSAARATLRLEVQFWTSRGFAVVDVDYGGSSGFGRNYREALNGQWGIVDVEDMVNAVRTLVDRGCADPARLIVRGGSAGGYTALAALTFHPGVFTAAASYYGISDLEVLARDTHKFESRYNDSLIGPYPEMREIYRARSPIHFVDRLSCALILFQGLEDKVVPPNQSEMMAAAVRSRGWPIAYLAFEGEQHGFRRAETIVHSLEAELAFYGAVFGFTAADTIAPIAIDNLPR